MDGVTSGDALKAVEISLVELPPNPKIALRVKRKSDGRVRCIDLRRADARYVMPHFNDGFATRRAAYDFNLQNRDVQLAALEEGIRTTNEQYQEHAVSGNPLPPVQSEADRGAKK